MFHVHLIHSDAGRGDVEEAVTDFPSLLQALESLSARYEPVVHIPYAVDLVSDGAGRLSVGMGPEGWMLTYQPEDPDGLAANAVGDRSATGNTSFFFGDHTLVSRKYLVPKPRALHALREWWEFGRLDPALEWSNEIF
jgi:Immunity protein Imm1